MTALRPYTRSRVRAHNERIRWADTAGDDDHGASGGVRECTLAGLQSRCLLVFACNRVVCIDDVCTEDGRRLAARVADHHELPSRQGPYKPATFTFRKRYLCRS